jgi:diguanylate cyclase (GGDEF)-like protein
MSRIPVTEVHPLNDPTPTLVDDAPARATEQPSHLRRRRDDNTHVFVIHIIAGSDTVQFATVLPGETMTLGRDPACGFHVHDGRVSRQHLTIECHENNRGCTIHDLDSKNGTRLDGELLDQSALIRQRGDVRVGDSLLRIERMTCAQMSYMDRHLRQVKEASLDSLTRLLSRRTLYERVPGMLKEHQASGTTVSAIFIDVDHFKTINDAHGHLAGDNILRGVARILKDATRQRDRVFRYGGDEFLLILSGCDLEGAHATAQRILNRATAAEWLVNSDTPVQLSLSAGVTQYEGGSLDMLIDGADQTMLKAKKCGRNIALCTPTG